jgi:hypothetical protein
VWLDNLIIEGIQRLLILRLKNSPALDTINPLIDTWVYVFKAQAVDWNEALDTPRIRKAFLHCAGKVDEFPSPRTVLQYLPSRPDVLKLPDMNRKPMPNSIKQVLNNAIEDSRLRSDEQRREFMAAEKEKLERMIRVARMN